MELKLYGHYYKHRKKTKYGVRRITILEFLDNNNVLCANGHITSKDKPHMKFTTNISKIKTDLSDEEREALKEADLKRKRRNIRNENARQAKKRRLRQYQKRFDELSEALFQKGIVIPLIIRENMDLEELE